MMQLVMVGCLAEVEWSGVEWIGGCALSVSLRLMRCGSRISRCCLAGTLGGGSSTHRERFVPHNEV